MKKIIIAIDGYSSCGKSTLAKALAKELGYAYVDSGAMYRAVALYFLNQEISLINKAEIEKALSEIEIEFRYNPQTQQSETYLNNVLVEQQIRSMEVSSVVSEVSAIKEVRFAMAALQRRAGLNSGIVMDGRDIGTNIFPNAELKIFMTAEPDIRAERRCLELAQKGQAEPLEKVKENLVHRDYVDTHREENPLVQANDAIVLDNSNLLPEEQLEIALGWALREVEDLSA